MQRLSLLLKATADPARLRILNLLFLEGELCVCQLVAALDLPYGAASRHLSLLKLHGLLEDDKRGRWVYYSIKQEPAPAVANLLGLLRELLLREQALLGHDLERARLTRCCDLEDLARLGARALKPGGARKRTATAAARRKRAPAARRS